MAFFIEGQVIVQLTDFIGGWFFKPSCCLLQWLQFESTEISRLCSQLESELFVRTYVVGANLAVVLFNWLSKQMLIIRANVWRLIDALTEANYSFQPGI